MNKTIVITGGNSGIGKALIGDFMRDGNNVIMIARDSEKTTKAYNELKSLGSGNSLKLLTGDLSVPADINKIISELNLPIDILINNAGLLKRKKEMSAEGIEMTMSVNYFAVFRLTMGLINKNNRPKRVINITSELFKKGELNIDDIIDPQKYNGQQVYANSKLANLMFSNELYKEYSNNVEVLALHPGVVATDSFRDYPKWFANLLNRFLEKPESASKKIFEIAISNNIKSGYYNQNEFKDSMSHLVDDEQSKELFEFSKQYLL